LSKQTYGIASSVLRRPSKCESSSGSALEEMKLPIKVLLLMLCILPVLFIVIRRPAAINIIAAFSNM
jgi:hypothetical protein